MTRQLALGLCAAVLLMLTAGWLLLSGCCPWLNAGGRMMDTAPSGKVICIYTQQELRTIGDGRTSLIGCCVLGRDMVVSRRWKTIDSRGLSVIDAFDENGHVLRGLRFKHDQGATLFGVPRNTEIRNVALKETDLGTIVRFDGSEGKDV